MIIRYFLVSCLPKRLNAFCRLEQLDCTVSFSNFLLFFYLSLFSILDYHFSYLVEYIFNLIIHSDFPINLKFDKLLS